MSAADLRVAVGRECDLAVLKAMRDIARDASRLPRVAATTTSEYFSKAEISWTRTDSPKREACLSVGMRNAGGIRLGGRERAHAIARLILETAFEDRLQTEDLDRWERDLRDIALHAALHDVMDPEHRPSLSDNCSAMAGTPWRPAVATRHRVERREWDVVTMDEDRIARHLPGLPMIVLIRSASLGRRGVINVGMTPFRGSTPFQTLDAVARLRAMERFS